MIDYTLAAEAVSNVVKLRQRFGAVRPGHILAQQLRLLDKCEAGMTQAYVRAGMNAEDAATSAVAFMAQVVKRCVEGDPPSLGARRSAPPRKSQASHSAPGRSRHKPDQR